MGLAAMKSILFGQIISLLLGVFDFFIQVRQFGYVAARYRPSRNVCLASLICVDVFVGCDGEPTI
jgi:hypothetical protein